MKKVLLLAMAIFAVLALSGAHAYAADSITVNLTAQNDSGQNGTAVLTDMGDGTTMVVVDISGGSDTPQPAHIHDGTCANLNPKPKWPLTNVVNGMSETVVPVSLSDLTSGVYAINVHKSAAEASVYVACGNIEALVIAGMPQTGVSSFYVETAALVGLALIVTVLGWRLSRRRA